MNLIKKMSAACLALTALCGCWPQEDPNKIYTIVLDSGKSQRTLKIPAGYIEEKNEKHRAKEGIRVGFFYPDLTPFVNKTPTKNSVSVYIRVISDPSRQSMSELSLKMIKKWIQNSSSESPASYLGKFGIYDVYEDTDTQTKSITKTYFARDKNGILIEFRYSQGHLTLVRRRFAEVFEVSYGYSPLLQEKQLEVDEAVTKLIESWLQN